MSMLSTAMRWLSAKSDLQTQRSELVNEIEDREANPPRSIDPAAHDEHQRAIAGLRDRLRNIDSALLIAKEEQEKAEAAEARSLEEAEAGEMEKLAAATAKLVPKLEAVLRQAAALRDEIADKDARIAEYNSRRGARPFVADGETRARQRMGHPLPAITETRDVWVDSEGQVVPGLTTDKDGRSIPNPAAARREAREFTIREEIPASPLPFNRFSETLVLIGSDGRRL